MSKFVLSMGLVLASLTGLAGAVESKASTLPVQATPSLTKFSAAAERNRLSFRTLREAEVGKLDLEEVGYTVSEPYSEYCPEGENGVIWYLDIE